MISKKPQGVITRGTTAPNRLRRVDRWLMHSECSRLRVLENPVVVDLGYGASPITTFEMQQRLAKHVRSDIEVVGIEIDPVRVAQAQSLNADTLHFIKGGFEVPVAAAGVDVIRALNVLRQYDEAEVWPAWTAMCRRINPGGLLIDGTCDEIGRLAVWVAVRSDEKQKPQPVSLTLSVNLQTLQRPSDVSARLPKILIHHNVPGQPIHNFLSLLDDAWIRTSSTATFGARQHWIAMLEYATAHGLVTLDSVSRWRLGEVTIAWAVVEPV